MKRFKTLAKKIVKENQNKMLMLNVMKRQSEEIDFHQEPPNNPQKFIHLQLIIRDSGIGINSQDLGNLFMDFGKLDDKEGRNRSGTGLGLSICKQIINEMGGSISVKSKVNTGTEFIIDMKVQGK